MLLNKSWLLGILKIALAIALAGSAAAQTPSAAKEVFFDSDGIQISNNEFVDIRMANFHYPDATIVKKYDDGRVEFRLQKVPQEGMSAPNFSVRTLDGKTVSLADLKGKVVVLNFWFIGCPVCRAIKPQLNNLRAKFAGNDNVVFLAMTADPAGDVRKYLDKEPSTYLHAADAKAAMDRFVFAGFPKNIVVSKTGEIVYWRSTVKAWGKFESVIRRAMER